MSQWKRIVITSLMAISVSWAEPSRAQQFAVMGYEGLVRDAGKGEGPYLKTLLELLAVPEGQRADTIRQIADLSKSEVNILRFSEKVAALIGSPASTSAGPAAVAAPLPAGYSLYEGAKLVGALDHLTRGMAVTVYLASGETVSGTVADYANRRLRLRGDGSFSFSLSDIRAIATPSL